jgi:zinc and cadmium transporter
MVDPITALLALVAGIVISMIAFGALVTLSMDIDRVRNVSQFLVALAAGVMVGGATLHLLPRTVEDFGGLTLTPVLALLSGILASYGLEAAWEWHHCRQIGGCEEPSHRHKIGIMNLYGDGVHNFIDGAVIAASFIASPVLGFSITLAIALHEIPQEFGDFGVLIQAGYSRRRALTYNFLSALTAMVGVLLILFLGDVIGWLVFLLLPFAAGNFIYISLTDLMPELHKERRTRRTFVQFVMLLLGIAVMGLLIFFE